MKETITRKPKEREMYYNLFMEIYQSMHYTVFMSVSDYSDPVFHIQNTETRESPEITGVNWKDLKDVMNALEILEEEHWRDVIGE